MNLMSVHQSFATEDDALDYLVKSRWPEGVRCISCDHDKVYAISTKGKTGKPCRLFECAKCGLHFSATTGTLFHDSHLPLQKWFMAMALMCEAKKGISALQISRHLGVQYKTAWYLCHRIRKAMQEQEMEPLGSKGQVVEIDETYIGGKKRRKGVKAGMDAKIKVLGMAEHNGRVHLRTIPDSTADSIAEVVQPMLSHNAREVVTDGQPAYCFVIPKHQHLQTDHTQELKELGYVSMKTVEGAFSLFKRGVIGSYHKLGKDHLDSYLGEFCWRYNRRKAQPWMFQNLLREVSTKKPMTYKTLTREIF